MNLSPPNVTWPSAYIHESTSIEGVQTVTKLITDPDVEFYIKIGKHRFITGKVTV